MSSPIAMGFLLSNSAGIGPSKRASGGNGSGNLGHV